MRSSKRGRNAASGPLPQIFLNPDDPFLVQRIGQVMCWPNEPDRWNAHSATMGSEVFHMAGSLDPGFIDSMVGLAITARAAEIGCSPDELVTPEARAQMTALLADHGPEAIREMMDKLVFQPAGGHLAVARAPGSQVLQAEMERAAQVEGNACGVALILVAQMALFHPEISASLNRALHVMAEIKKQNRAIQWPAERAFKDAWKRYRPVVPLWASMLMLQHAVQIEAQQAGKNFDFAVLTVLVQLPQNKMRCIAWARWFRDFTCSHVPMGAAGPLIPDAALHRLEAPILAEMPPLGPLDPAAYRSALAYLAPTPNQ